MTADPELLALIVRTRNAYRPKSHTLLNNTLDALEARIAELEEVLASVRYELVDGSLMPRDRWLLPIIQTLDRNRGDDR